MKMSVTISCDCGNEMKIDVKKDQYGLQLIESIDATKAFNCTSTIDYTFLIHCKCGNEEEIF